MPHSTRIAIIGAGPSGLTLANLLVRHSIIPDVFERDESPDARKQGGTLDLHEGSGQEAVREAGLWDAFRKHARYDGQEAHFVTKNGRVIGEDHGKKEGDKDTQPEIDRYLLRDVLLQSLDSGIVRWGHTLESVEPGEGGTYSLKFKGGKVESGYNLVVGADGAWSRVRSLVSSVEPFYSGISFVDIKIPHPVGSRYDAVNAAVGRGSIYAFGDQKCIIAQRQGDNSIHIYAGFHTGEDATWAHRFRDESPDTVLDSLASHYAGWEPTYVDYIRLADKTNVACWPLYMLPVGHRWEHRAGVTVIGDAAHVMTPFAGEGVNAAMWDSLELAKRIMSGVEKGDLDAAVRESEEALFKRAQEVTKRTEDNMKLFFSPGDIEEKVDEISQLESNE